MTDKDYTINLTLAVYKVTSLFSEKEPLRYKIRQKAGDILEDLICLHIDKKFLECLLRDIETINSYFIVAEKQKWANPRNFLILQYQYNKLGEKLSIQTEKKKSAKIQDSAKNDVEAPKVSPRQEKIVGILKQKAPLRLIELQEYFPDLNKRTLRRDVGSLIFQNIVKRYEQGKLTFYELIK